MRDINLGPLRSQRRSRRPLFLVGLLCVVFASLVLIVVLFTKPEVKRPQFVEERVRLPMKSIEKEGEPRIPGVVEEEGMEEKPLEGGILDEEKPIVSESPEPLIVIQESGADKKVLILGEKEAPREEKEVTGDQGEVKKPEIEGSEEEKTQVAMVEDRKGPSIPEVRLPTSGYTVNIASFRDKGNADRLMKELEEKGYEAFIEKVNIAQKGTWYRVAMGRFSSREEALTFAQGLKEKGISYSFVRQLKYVKK
jgi:cell division septation protein DedD